METSYKVIYTGEVHGDFNLIKVEEGFAKLFKISPEKAATFLTPNKVIKKDLTQSRANTYKSQLEKIGMLIKIECEQPEFAFEDMALESADEQQTNKSPPSLASSEDNFATSFDGLSVVGLEDQFAPSTPIDQTTNLSGGQITCPKCATVQDKAEQCISCGVYVQKILNQQTKDAQDSQIPYQQYIKEEDLETANDTDDDQSNTALPYIVGLVVALVGALIWNYIAATFYYEIGWVAIIIGSSIGAAVAFFNKSGKDLSVICAALALSSILGGKYLIAESEKDYGVIEMNEVIAYIPEDQMRLAYYQMINETQEFLELIYDEDAFKGIMITALISEGYDPDSIPIDRLYDYLNSNLTPYIEALNIEKPGFEQWSDEFPLLVEGMIRSFPTIEIMKMMFTWVDWIFLFLGVSAAFQISRKQY